WGRELPGDRGLWGAAGVVSHDCPHHDRPLRGLQADPEGLRRGGETQQFHFLLLPRADCDAGGGAVRYRPLQPGGARRSVHRAGGVIPLQSVSPPLGGPVVSCSPRLSPPTALSSFPSTSSLDCLSCSSSDHSCSGPSLTRIRCLDPREQCVDITAISMPEEFPQDERRIKGCGQISQCQEPLGFHNQDSFYLLQCCNSTLCNNDAHDYEESPLPLNGVTCYACEGNSGHGCAPEHVTAVQCQGPMTHCMEAVGSHGEEPQNQQGVPCCGGGAGATIP
uniref:UPAR/Ly6 domain-containing protein n=1 Tax=Terrapene triunguis TaxID=2587831 RepID=A0A674J2M9_9SAUR